MRTLLLDNSFFPVKIVGWQKAMILLITGRAEVIDEYPDRAIRSPAQNYQLPKILRLYNKHRSQKKVRFTRLNVYWRDKSTCQYCYKKHSLADLTFDHVIPISKGGQTNWENIVTACAACNTKKSNKTPKEARMRLLKVAVEPKWSPQLCLKLKEDDPQEWFDWFPGALASSA
jgi:5-methylcytosine-specific restriction endonuclease McrA